MGTINNNNSSSSSSKRTTILRTQTTTTRTTTTTTKTKPKMVHLPSLSAAVGASPKMCLSLLLLLTTSSKSSFQVTTPSSSSASSSSSSSPCSAMGTMGMGMFVEAIPLLHGRFETSTDVTGYTFLGYDVAQMKETEERTEKMEIYNNGRNAFYTDINGQKSTLSLAMLSLNAGKLMNQDPMYNLFRHSLLRQSSENNHQLEQERRDGTFLGRPVEEYANTIVQHIFTDLIQQQQQLSPGSGSGSSSTIQDVAVEGALVLNVWMAIMHELNNVVRGCANGNVDESQMALDKAAALWIGVVEEQEQQQEEHSSESTSEQGFEFRLSQHDGGHLLYKLAETAGQRFQLNNHGGSDGGSGGHEEKTSVNNRVLRMFNSLQTNLSNNLSCLEGFENTIVRQEVESLIGTMTIPLVQNLIHHVMQDAPESFGEEPSLTNDNKFIELYALSVAPRIVSCDPNLHDFLLTMNLPSTATIKERRQAVETIQSTYSCLRITCADVGEYKTDGITAPKCHDGDEYDDSGGGTLSMAGYTTPRTSVRPYSYIDRDILQLKIYLESNAYEAAMDLYKYGHNSAPISLQQLALNQVIPHTSHSPFDVFKTYHEAASYTFVDSIILAALQKNSPYDAASSDQITGLVVGLLRFVVVQLNVMASLQYAVEECWDRRADSALQYWDIGAALYIGSIEGTRKGGQEGGQLLYGTAKELCDQFGTCTKNEEDAAVNVAIVNALNDALKLIVTRDCNAVNTTVNQISRVLPITLIQGTLAYVSINDGLAAGSADASLATGFAFSQSVLPYVEIGNERSAMLIRRNTELDFDQDSPPVPDGFLAVADAFRLAFETMQIDCNAVGTLSMGHFCPPDRWIEPDPTTTGDNQDPKNASQAIAFGRYDFTSDDVAETYAKFALDIRDMVQAETIDDARVVYRYGYNAAVLDSSEVVQTLNIASFSTDAASIMSQDPTFNIFKFALYDEDALAGDNNFIYADEVVMEALNRASDQVLAADAAVALNIWMMIAHKLHSSVRMCRQGRDGAAQIDAAVALWIGYDQDEGSSDNGWMMYSLGQTAAEHFEQARGEAEINSRLMIQFNELQKVASQCSVNPDLYLDLRFKVEEAIRLLSVPLLQQLLYCIASDDRWHVELYAMAVVSQFVAYNPQAYMELSAVLFSGFSREKVDDLAMSHLATLMNSIRISCDDIGVTAALKPSLQDLTDVVCQKIAIQGAGSPIKGYKSTTDVREESRIDLDVLQIGIFMRTRANEAAHEVYLNGRNSRDSNSSFLSLHALATMPERLDSLDFDIYSAYYGSESYANDLILSTLLGGSHFGPVSAGQLAAIVTSALQTMVSYRAILSKLHSSIQKCEQLAFEQAQAEWDGAVAMFVGSIEMAYPQNATGGAGQLMYSLALQQCEFFDTCVATGEASNNVAILAHFINGTEAIKNGNCDAAQSRVASSIAPLMQTSVIQGILHNSIQNENLGEVATEESLSTGYIMVRSIEPLVNNADPISAKTIADNLQFPVRYVAVPEGASAIFGAIVRVLSSLSIDCKDIGQPISRPNLTVCFDPTEEGGLPAPEGVQVYVTTTSVEQQANLALDVADMARAQLDGMPEVARLIYSEGKNSKVFDDNGQFAELRTLEGLSVDASSDMLNDSLFNIFLFAIREGFDSPQIGEANGRRLFLQAMGYADEVVQTILASDQHAKSTLASEASVSLNVWMYVAHLVYKIERSCTVQNADSTDGVHTIDEVAAYWIGDGQGLQESNGHLLYGMAEVMGQLFGTLQNGQSRVNRKILALLNQAKEEISSPNSCTGRPESYTRIHAIANKLVSVMSVPLVQALVHNIRALDKDRVTVYAHSFVPITAGCNPETFAFLRDKLVNSNFDWTESDEVIARIYDVFPCLGIQCEDFGMYYLDAIADNATSTLCINSPPLTPLAGYHPASEVAQYAVLDLDILEIDILMDMGAFESALGIYLHGKHAQLNSKELDSLSLAQVAAYSERNDVEVINAFRQYYESDDFTNRLIKDAITGDNDSLTKSERRTLVVLSSQVLITFIGIASFLEDSPSECEANPGTVPSWDKAAALFVGHLEGPSAGGSFKNGRLLFNLAQEQCKEFGTCTSESVAMVNEKVLTLFYAGRGAAKSNSCGVLEKTGKEIQSNILIPLIQATLSSSIRLSTSKYDRRDLLHAHIYSRAVLPLVAQLDRVAARVLEDAFDLKEKLLPLDEELIFAAFSRAYEGLGVNCKHVGKIGLLDACHSFEHVDLDSFGSDNGKQRRRIHLSQAMISIVAIVVVIIVSALLILRMESRKKKTEIPRNKREEFKSFLRRKDSFHDRRTLLSSEAVRLTSSLRFSEYREANDGDSGASDATIVTSNVDTKEDSDII